MSISLTRRTALALAGSAAVTLGAVGAAIATNSGLLGGSGAPAEVGNLDARNVSQLVPDTTLPVQPEVQYLDETIVVPPPPAPDAAPTGDPSVSPSAPAASPSAPVVTPGPAPVPTPTRVDDRRDGDHRDDDRRDDDRRDDDRRDDHDDDRTHEREHEDEHDD